MLYAWNVKILKIIVCNVTMDCLDNKIYLVNVKLVIMTRMVLKKIVKNAITHAKSVQIIRHALNAI